MGMSVFSFAFAIYHVGGTAHKDAVILGLLLFVTAELVGE